MDERVSGVWRRLSRRVFVYDISTSLSLALIWCLLFQAAELAVVGGLLALRLVVLMIVLRRQFAPVLAWESRRTELGDAQLFAAERATSMGATRFARIYAASAAGTLVSTIVLALVGIPRPLPLGGSEVAMAGLFALSILGVVPVVRHLLEGPLAQLRSELEIELSARELRTQREARSLVSQLVNIQVVVTLSIYVAMGSIGAMVHLRHLRVEAGSELRRLVELAIVADRVEAALDHDPGFSLIEQLPELLLAVEERGPLAVRIARDPWQAEMLVAARVEGKGWLLARRRLDEQLWLLATVLLSSAALVAASLVSATSSFARGLALPLRALRRATRRLVEGGELHGFDRLVRAENDEVGALVRDFNAMLEMMRELASVADKVAAGDLSVELERSGEVQDAFRAMTSRLRELVVEIRTAAVEIGAASTQIRASLTAQEGAAQGQLESVTGVSATAASLAESAKDIAVAAKHVLDDAEHGLDTTELVVQKIRVQRSAAGGIAELLQVIREIADRSDLIALNGALEAGRAGSEGRGFALIADEMRRLAERVTGTVADVGGHVKSIEHSGAETVSATDESRRIAERTTEAARAISELTQRQAEDTEVVLSTIIDVADAARATATASAQTHAVVQGLADEATRLEQITAVFELERSEVQDA